MLSEGEKARTIRYILDRRCPSGGYCFYQLDEPNLSDTWYGLGCLQILNQITPDEKTEEYLSRYHDQTTGISGLYRLWYLYWSYMFLKGDIPEILIQNLASYPLPTLHTTGTVESSSIFESLYCYAILCADSDIKIQDSYREKIQAFINRWHHSSGGYGRDKATLVETRHVVAIFSAVGINLDLDEINSFLEECIDEQSGFVNVPLSRPGYLEHLDAGIALARLLNHPVPNKERCLKFLENCRKDNGGYARSGFGGNATLEYSWYAIRSLDRLSSNTTWKW